MRERERDREQGLPLPLVHPPMAAAASALRPEHRADPMAGARCFSWSPMGCRAQVPGPSSTALPGHSRDGLEEGQPGQNLAPRPGLEPGVPAPQGGGLA